MNRHDSLFVVDAKEIIAMLTFSDVYQKVSEFIKKCHLEI